MVLDADQAHRGRCLNLVEFARRIRLEIAPVPGKQVKGYPAVSHESNSHQFNQKSRLSELYPDFSSFLFDLLMIFVLLMKDSSSFS